MNIEKYMIIYDTEQQIDLKQFVCRRLINQSLNKYKKNFANKHINTQTQTYNQVIIREQNIINQRSKRKSNKQDKQDKQPNSKQKEKYLPQTFIHSINQISQIVYTQMSQYRKYIDTVVLQSPISINNNSDSQKSLRNTNPNINNNNNNNNKPRSKDKVKLHPLKYKQTFLTDTQTSDHTKSSNQSPTQSSLETLSNTIKLLKKQNHQLKQQLLDLKSTCFFNINHDKLKQLILQNDKLKQQLIILKKKLDQSFIQRDYLQRLNKNLKSQYSQATREILTINRDSSPKVQNQRSSRNINKNLDFEDQSTKKVQRLSVNYLEEAYRSRNPPSNQDKEEKLYYKPRQSVRSRQKQDEKILKKSRSTSKIMQNEYFIGKGLRQDPKKQKKNKRSQQQ